MTATRRPVSAVGVAEVKALETSNPRYQCMSLGPPLGLAGLTAVYCQRSAGHAGLHLYPFNQHGGDFVIDWDDDSTEGE
jgi:hypothetical protein